MDEKTAEVVGESSPTVHRLSATTHEVLITWAIGKVRGYEIGPPALRRARLLSQTLVRTSERS